MSDPCFKPGLMPFEQAQKALQDAAEQYISKVPRKIRSVPIWEADGNIVASEVISPIAVPGHDNSAMDGYALNLSSDALEQTSFEVVGAAFAGQPFQGELGQGQAIKIMTGAKLPEGANAVEMKENVERASEQQITLQQPARLNANIRRAGEDIELNQTVFVPGHRLSPADVGLLASLGKTEIEVYAPPKVAIFSTGDELKAPGQALSDGDIYESNRYVVITMLRRLGAEVIDLGIIPDDKSAITDAFLRADAEADLVLSSGGVSVGDADYTKEVLDDIGQVGFWKIAMKPGKPLAFGSLPNSLFMGLPGNPVSATVTFYHLAKRVIDVLSHADVQDSVKFSATTTAKIKKRPGRRDFQRGIAYPNEQGQWVVEPLSQQGSGILSSISRANCFIDLPADNAGYQQGEQVMVEMFAAYLK